MTTPEIRAGLRRLVGHPDWKALVWILRHEDGDVVDQLRQSPGAPTEVLFHNERIRNLVRAAFQIGETDPFSDSHLRRT